MTAILYGDLESEVDGAAAAEGDLWLPLEGLPAATGWELKPEGVCRGEICVPLPRGREAEFVRDGRFNLSALARLIDLPAARDADGAAWAFAEGAAERPSALAGSEAPDFALPDLAGKVHKLSDYRGQKVFLVSWASW
jgi:hypothetical protein